MAVAKPAVSYAKAFSGSLSVASPITVAAKTGVEHGRPQKGFSLRAYEPLPHGRVDTDGTVLRANTSKVYRAMLRNVCVVDLGRIF